MKPVKKAAAADEGSIVADNAVQNLGFGFVSYTTQDSAQKARLEATNNVFRGKHLVMKWFVPKNQRDAHKEEEIDQQNFLEHIKIKKAQDGEKAVKSIVERLQANPDTFSSYIVPFTKLLSQTPVGQNIMQVIKMCLLPQTAVQRRPYVPRQSHPYVQPQQ